MEKQAVKNNWSENVLIIDADYVDNVAFNLIVNFERIIGRRIPQADLARWLVCLALDGGVRLEASSLFKSSSCLIVSCFFAFPAIVVCCMLDFSYIQQSKKEQRSERRYSVF